MQNGRAQATHGAGGRWIIQWDSPEQMAWIGVGCLPLVMDPRVVGPDAAGVVRSTGAGRWWLLLVVLGASARGHRLALGSVLWFAWTRPRLRRGPRTRRVATAGGAEVRTGVIGEPLI